MCAGTATACRRAAVRCPKRTSRASGVGSSNSKDSDSALVMRSWRVAPGVLRRGGGDLLDRPAESLEAHRLGRLAANPADPHGTGLRGSHGVRSDDVELPSREIERVVGIGIPLGVDGEDEDVGPHAGLGAVLVTARIPFEPTEAAEDEV